MWKNYLKIAWRNILRNKLRSAIHILGLALGIASCFLVFNLVTYSHSFDKFHPDVERIFRVETLTDFGDGGAFPNSGTPGPLGKVINEEVSGVAEKGRLYTLQDIHVSLPDQKRVIGRSPNVTFADPEFFQVFPRSWLAGNPHTALQSPSKVVISRSSMQKYFPEMAPLEVLGKSILYVDADTVLAEVSGVVEDYTENTDFIFTDFVSYSTIDTPEKEEWYGLHDWGSVNSSSQLFIKLEQGADPAQVNEGLAALIAKHEDDEGDGTTSFSLTPLSDMHFSENYNNTSVSKVFLNGLVYIGTLILVLATLNFINLETAQAIGRSREVGIRKALGGMRTQLVSQFLIETYVIVLLALVLGLAMVGLLQGIFATYLPYGFEINYLSWSNVGFYTSFPLLLTALTGIYPAFVSSAYQPHRALKGETGHSKGFSLGVFLRKNLTVLQFASSIGFVILVLVLNHQLHYVSSQPMGFEKDAVLYTNMPFMSDPGKMEQFRNRLTQDSRVASASLSGNLVSSTSLWTSDVSVQIDSTVKEIYIQVMNVDSAFVSANGIPLLAGNTGNNRPQDLVVNRRFVKEMGLADVEAAIGMTVKYSGEERRIVGVVEDFHSRTLREEIRPLILTVNPEYFQTISVKIHSGQNLAEAKAELEKQYKEFYPFEEEEFRFLDAQLDRFYLEDLRIRNVLGFACILAILISSMGLFGLSSYTIAQRIKELSIRKVLGASLFQLLSLISKEYLLLMAVAFALASYPAYYFTKDWLNGFQYRVDMPYLLFVLSGVGVTLLCLLIVGLHSYVAAQTNPAKVLRNE